MCGFPRWPLARLLAVLSVTTGLVLLSCGGDSEGDFLSGPRAAAAKEQADLALAGLDPRVRELWSRHDRTLERALTSERRFPEFDEACRFFEQLMPGALRLDFQYVGYVPTPATAEGLVGIREWLVQNADRLYWDETTKTVKVRPPAS